MKPMKPRFALFLLLALWGCDKSPPPAATTAAQAAPPPLAELRLGYFPNVTHAQAVLEVASGELQQALGSTHLKAITFNAGPGLIGALNGGSLDIAYVGPGPVLSTNQSSGGQSVRVIAGAAADGVCIVARKDSGITSMADLAGKKIATPELGNTQDTAARHYMTAVLGQSNADNVVPVRNAQQETLMAEGKLDAAWDPEPWASRLIADTGATLIAQEKDLWPQKRFALTVVITTPKFLADHPDIVKTVLTVHHQWTLRLAQDPLAYADKLNAALGDLTKKQLPAEVIRNAMSRTVFTDDPMPDTFATMGQWKFNSAVDLSALFQTDIINGLLANSPATTIPSVGDAK
jgi:NitT/TauT family transport system substrate-binding protein